MNQGDGKAQFWKPQVGSQPPEKLRTDGRGTEEDQEIFCRGDTAGRLIVGRGEQPGSEGASLCLGLKRSLPVLLIGPLGPAEGQGGSGSALGCFHGSSDGSSDASRLCPAMAGVD